MKNVSDSTPRSAGRSAGAHGYGNRLPAVMKNVVCFLFLFAVATGKAQTITTFAGGGTVIGDGGPATAAILNVANGGVFDKIGNFYICEALGQRVRKISSTGIITRLAGTGSSGSSGDGGPATASQLSTPTDVTIDTLGNIYISALNNFKVRKVNAVTGIISTVAGTGVGGYNGDGIPATSAQIHGNEQIWLDKTGNLFICDRDNFRIRKVNTSGIISTVAGGTFSGTGSGDGGLATAAGFNMITGIAVDDTGNIFIADFNVGKVRKVNTTGNITTIAGNGSLTYLGDGMPATSAAFSPFRLTFDTSKNLVIADRYNRRVYKIDNAGIFHCIAGNGGTGFSGDGGPATAATLDFPAGVTFDPCGNLYIAEAVNKRVRKVTFNPVCDLTTLEAPITKIATNIVIYPNPANDEVRIDNAPADAAYVLYNLTGTAIQQGVLRQGGNAVSLRSLPAGIYLLQLTGTDGGRTTHRIIRE